MTKRIFILGFAMLLSTASAFAQYVGGGTTGPLTWEVTGTAPNYTLTISGNGEMPDDAYMSWYPYREFITIVVIGNDVTTIGKLAFYQCALTSMTIPNGITRIGGGAFYGCNKLTTVNFNATNCTTEDILVFVDCTSLSTLNIGNNVTKIPDVIFCGCSGFTGTLTIPNSVTSIGEHAFEGCSGFTGTLTIPNSVTSIGDRAFDGCSGFTGTLTIPNSVTSIGGFAFFGCNKLTTVNFNATNCTTTGWGVFPSCTSLSTLNIGNNVTNIPDAIFASCSGFTGTLTIPDAVTSIGSEAFEGCSGFTGTLTIPNGVTKIDHYAFRECSSFSSVTIPSSVTYIGVDAFYGCHFTTITIPETVTDIGSGAFFNDSANGLSVVNFNAVQYRVRSWTDGNNYPTFYGTSLTVNIGNAVDSIKQYLFYSPDNINGSPAPIPNITSITTYAETPPVLVDPDAFKGAAKDIPVHIPCYTIESYKNASGWGDYFTNIIAPNSYSPQLCMISVNENDHNEIVWKKQEGVASYNIYREGSQGDEYDLVANVDDSSPNSWIDTESNAKMRSYRYKISGIDDDRCGESLLSDPHRTMHLTINAGQNNSWNLIWTAYEGTDYSTYNIYRASGATMGEMELIGTMPAGNTTYSDFSAPADYVYYMVEIMLNEACEVGRSLAAIKSNIATNNPGVSIDEISDGNIKLFPNPVKDILTITNYELEMTSVKIYDLLGKEVLESRLSDGKVDVSPLSPGGYVLRIGGYAVRFVKE